MSQNLKNHYRKGKWFECSHKNFLHALLVCNVQSFQILILSLTGNVSSEDP